MKRDFYGIKIIQILFSHVKRRKYNKTGGNTAKNTRQKIVTRG